MIDKPLSFSGYSRYMQCPKFFQYHRDGLRSQLNSSALLFGSAVDDMINALLEAKADPWLAFEAAWSMDQLKKTEWTVEDCDMDLISDEQTQDILVFAQKKGYKGDNLRPLVSGLFQKIESCGYTRLTDNQRSILNAVGFLSMKEKARLILARYKEEIIPKIEEVTYVQKEITLNNGKIYGISDFVATIQGEGKVLLDNKTSKRPFKRTRAKHDPQLALYAEALGCTKVGFVVMLKNMKKNAVHKCEDCGDTSANHMHKSCPNDVNGKRCKGNLCRTINPRASIQFIVDTLEPRAKVNIVEAMVETQKLIDTEIFPRNLGACEWMYGKPCLYIDKCRKGKEDGLIKKEDNRGAK